MRRALTVAGGCAWAVVLGLAISCSDEDDDGSGLLEAGGTSAAGGSGNAGGSGATDGGSSGGAAGAAGSSASGGTGGGPEPLPPCESLEGLPTDCGQNTVAAEIKVVNALLVVDKSGSMEDPLGESTKWDALKEALGTALPNVQDKVNFGLLLYPSPSTRLDCTGTDCCSNPVGDPPVNVNVAPSSVSSINTALNGTGPGGGTPTAAALKEALAYYTTGEGAGLEGDKYVVLATDGGPNCNQELPACEANQCTRNLDMSGDCLPDGTSCCSGAASISCLDDVEVVKAITQLKDAGIQTFVIGLPGTEAYASYLNNFAVAGGQPNPNGPESYYAVDAAGGVQGLTQVFTDITRKLVQSCEILLTMEPEDWEKVNVAVDCEAIPPEDSTTGNGWDPVPMSGGEPAKILLKGPVCDNYIKTTGAERVDVLIGCPKIMVR